MYRLFPTVLLSLGVATAFAQDRGRQSLDIYLLDVEGGNATLFVAPSGESLLIDTGNGGPAAARDAGRIMAAVEDAGVRQIDHLITTHYHGDHFGAMEELANRLPILEFIDHGTNVQPSPATDAFLRHLCGLACERLARRRETRRSRAVRRCRRTDRDLSRQRHRAAVARRRRSESPVREPCAERPRPFGKCAIRRQPLHVRPLPCASPRRPHVEQRIRLDVPEQSARRRRSLHRDASRSAGVERAGARPRDSIARGCV